MNQFLQEHWHESIVLVLGLVLFVFTTPILRLIIQQFVHHKNWGYIYANMVVTNIILPFRFLLLFGCFSVFIRWMDTPIWLQSINDCVLLLYSLIVALRSVDLAIRFIGDQQFHSMHQRWKILLNPIKQTIKFLLVLMTASFALQELGYNPLAWVASLSVGSLALALASKDTVANMFGLAVVVGDAPFKIGDRIKIKSTEGKVKSIGIRSTTLEMDDGTDVTIPNQQFTNSEIYNFKEKQ